MIRLTVLYNLAPGQDEEKFLAWRLGEHQHENASQPGVVRTDFGIAREVFPEGAPIPYRFMTTADWPDMASFRAAFYEENAITTLKSQLHLLENPLFLVTEILAEDRP